jgi:hypothetical protein
MDKFIKGELVWIKTQRDRPEEYEGKKTWSITQYPDKDGLELVRELQAIGIKNKLKRDDKGWFVKWSRPTEQVKNEKVVKVFDPPIIVDSDGNVIDGPINNGAIGTVKIDFTEGKTSKGKYYTARLVGAKLDTYSLWEGSTAKAVETPKQEAYF